MKKFLFTALIFACLTFAGCLQGHSHLIITDDGKVFMQNRLIGVPLIANQIESFKKTFDSNPNAEISPVIENNMSGYDVKLNYPSIEAFAADGIALYTTKNGKCKGIQRKNGWFFDAYNFDLISSVEKTFSPSQAAVFQSMLSQISFELTIELPYSAESHNADKFDAENRILTWNLAPVMIGGGEKHIHAQFKLRHRENIAITLLVEIFLAVGAIFFHKKSRAEESTSILKSLMFKRNVFAGLFVAIGIISAYMILSPVIFSDSDIISAELGVK